MLASCSQFWKSEVAAATSIGPRLRASGVDVVCFSHVRKAMFEESFRALVRPRSRHRASQPSRHRSAISDSQSGVPSTCSLLQREPPARTAPCAASASASRHVVMVDDRVVDMAAHYSRDTDAQEKPKPAVEKMEHAEETRTNCLAILKKVSREPFAEQKKIRPSC